MMNRLLLEKRSAAALCGWVALLIGVLFVEGCHAQEDADADADAERPPNIVFILSDDVGYGDLSCYGHPYSETPNLDRLASEGTKYTQFNVNGNVCPHTRAGFMTGRSPSFFPNYTAKYGFMGAVTITQLLKEAGYATGHIGKWNIGGDPERDAVDYGIDDLRRTSDLDGDPRGREGLRFDDAIDFVEQNADVPFYLNLWIHATHTPVEAPQDMVDRYQDLEIDRSDFSFWMQDRFDVVEARNGSIDENMHLYMADLHAMDLNVGRLLDTIDDLNLTDSTIVVFTSDNGPARPSHSLASMGYAGGLREGKHFYYEGGVRVPFIVRWPNHTPEGEVNDSLMFGLDWLPTICSLAGCTTIPWGLLEGEDMSDVFYGAVRDRQTPMLWRGIGPNPRRYHSTRWIRYGPWKLVEHDQELYNLLDDPEERVNLYDEETRIVEALIKTLHEWNQTLPTDHARPPMDPLPFDPFRPVPRLALPDIDLGVKGPTPTRPPSIAPSTMPTGPTGAPSVAPTSLTISPSVPPSAMPVLGPTTSSLSVAPTAPTTRTTMSPAAPTTGRTGPDCERFQALPSFTAQAHQYCEFDDSTVEDIGGFGFGGEVDIGANLPEGMQAFCGSSTFIRDTWPGEYVEYVFDTTSTSAALDLDITANVASPRRRQLTMGLFSSAGTELKLHSSATLEVFTQDWYNYTNVMWTARNVASGTYHLRIRFDEGFTNLCSIQVDSVSEKIEKSGTLRSIQGDDYGSEKSGTVSEKSGTAQRSIRCAYVFAVVTSAAVIMIPL